MKEAEDGEWGSHSRIQCCTHSSDHSSSLAMLSNAWQASVSVNWIGVCVCACVHVCVYSWLHGQIVLPQIFIILMTSFLRRYSFSTFFTPASSCLSSSSLPSFVVVCQPSFTWRRRIVESACVLLFPCFSSCWWVRFPRSVPLGFLCLQVPSSPSNGLPLKLRCTASSPSSQMCGHTASCCRRSWRKGRCLTQVCTAVGLSFFVLSDAGAAAVQRCLIVSPCLLVACVVDVTGFTLPPQEGDVRVDVKLLYTMLP